MASQKDLEKKPKIKKVISRTEKILIVGVIVILVVAIICVGVFLLYPKYAGRPDWQILGSLNFSDSTWIEDMAKNRIHTSDKILDINSSFVYSEDTAYITYNYASPTSVADAKKYYLSAIPGSVDKKADSVAQLNIEGTLNGERISIVNYEADMLNAYDMKVVLQKDKAETIKQKLIAEFPEQVEKSIPEFAPVIQNERLGGYILYNDDELSNTSYAGSPIFSHAYRYKGTKADLITIEKAIKDKYPDSVFFEDIGSVYFKDQGYILSLNYTESDANILAVITIQKIPDTAKTSK